MLCFPFGIALALLVAVLGAQAQTVTWCDDLTSICFQRFYDEGVQTGWGYTFPDVDPNGGVPDEFIGIYTGPETAGWIGASLGGGMTQNPLIVAWLNEGKAMAGVRRTEQYGPPAPYHEGPVLTILGSSGITASGEQRIVFRCQNCTKWEGGSTGVNLEGGAPFGFAMHGTIKPLIPDNEDSPVYQHSYAGIYVMDVPAAKTGRYYEVLEKLQGLPPLPVPGTEPEPTPTTTITTPPGPTTTTTTITTPPGPTPTIPAGSCPGASAPVYDVNVANGWSATAVLGRLSRPRSIAIDTRGNLLVLEGGKGVTAHTVDANGCVTSSTLVIDDPTLNHGMDLTPSGNKIIATSSDEAWIWDYQPSNNTAFNRKRIIYGMHNPGHVSRTVWVSKKYPDYVLVSVGSNANIDLPSFEARSGRAQIRAFDLRGLPTNGLPYTSGAVMGYGLRNDVGITEDRNGIIYSVENSLDNAYRVVDGNRTDVHTNNPAEKVYRLGDPRSPAGIFGGYPYCYTVWEGEDFTDSAKGPGDWFVQAPNATMNDAWCDANTVKPIALLPPHTAPLDIKFAPRLSDGRLYATLHGSWNRSPPQGYKVVVIPGLFSSTGEWSPSVNLASTKTSFTDLLSNKDETQCQTGCFRPVGLAFAHNGDWLYVSSDSSGEVVLLKRDADPAQPTTTIPPPTTTTTNTPGGPTPTTTDPSTPQQTLWGQCGGRGYTGPTQCPPGSRCNYVNLYFSQCVSGERWVQRKKE